MITQSGQHIQRIGGAAGTPTPQDIAIHSGRICRFGGAVWYPLLPHLIFVAMMVYRRKMKGNLIDSFGYEQAWRIARVNMIWGLLHDAHEVVTCDVPRPFKCDCMKREQNALDCRIVPAFLANDDISLIDFNLIKQCDDDAADIEATFFGINGYAEAELASYKTEKDDIHRDLQDMLLFQKIVSSRFNQNTVSAHSVGVQIFANCLQDIANRKGDLSQTDLTLGIFKAYGFLEF